MYGLFECVRMYVCTLSCHVQCDSVAVSAGILTLPVLPPPLGPVHFHAVQMRGTVWPRPGQPRGPLWAGSRLPFLLGSSARVSAPPRVRVSTWGWPLPSPHQDALCSSLRVLRSANSPAQFWLLLSLEAGTVSSGHVCLVLGSLGLGM